MPRLSVILPAYNESGHICQNILRVRDALREIDHEVIVVDDGSADATYAEAQRAAGSGPVIALQQLPNQGKGRALFRGFEAASGELVAFLDADLEIAPENILALIACMDQTGADVVIGTKSADRSQFPLARRVMSAGFRKSVAFLFGLDVSDTQTGIKLFRRDVLEDVVPRMRVSRFAFDIELLVAANRFGYTIAEVPVQVNYLRSGSLGRVRLGTILHTAADLAGIYYRSSFWRWLEPGLGTRIWMILFVLGIFLLGIGVGKLLTPVIVQPPISDVLYYLFLQFLPRTLRDWLLVIGGAALIGLSLIQLNKSILQAFARRDAGDLAGILRKSRRAKAPQDANSKDG